MHRNHYQGQTGDAVNAALSAAGFNLRKLLAFFLPFLAGTLLLLKSAWCWSPIGKPAHATRRTPLFQG